MEFGCKEGEDEVSLYTWLECRGEIQVLKKKMKKKLGRDKKGYVEGYFKCLLVYLSIRECAGK